MSATGCAKSQKRRCLSEDGASGGDVRIARFPREKTPCEHPHAAFGVDGAAAELAVQVWGKQLDPLELSRFAGPERLVAFLAVEHVEFRRAFFDRGAGGEAQ